ncbi:MAG: BlaI/MecI/CopY family transcriptional regulator [Gemmatimonadetes bacterium]|nr:BlaI/MecI/CopY family transcriptional regulator [Gemmatimonadota bacterium]
MNSLPKLSRREREVMDLAHELGNATAAQIQENMDDPPTYSAVRSTLRILVEKGHLLSERNGLRYVYSPTMPARHARRSAMRHVLRTFFGGSVTGAVATLLELRRDGLTPEEHARITEMIKQAAKEGR